jgi:protein-S-isoprenylcysteine O-methyltransferase Ste14
VGIAILLGGATIFRGAGTNIETNKPSTTVVTHGLYKFSRNPIYIGLTTLYLGLAYVADSWWTLILLIPVILIMRWGVIAREERYLEAKFGEAYVAYKARVRRWL